MKNYRPIGYGEGDFDAWLEDRPKSWVFANENGWIDLEETKFLNISEDLYGRDKVSFEYNGQEYESMLISSNIRPQK
jgi:hypothetical protein